MRSMNESMSEARWLTKSKVGLESFELICEKDEVEIYQNMPSETRSFMIYTSGYTQ